MLRTIGETSLTPTVHSETGLLPSRPVPGVVPEAGKLARIVLQALDDAKAEDIVSIDLRGKAVFADMMIVATGRATTHVGAIAERVIRACKDAGAPTPRVEGMPRCDWVLIDANDVIIHVLRPDVRQFYNLEKLWGGDRPAERGRERLAG